MQSPAHCSVLAHGVDFLATKVLQLDGSPQKPKRQGDCHADFPVFRHDVCLLGGLGRAGFGTNRQHDLQLQRWNRWGVPKRSDGWYRPRWIAVRVGGASNLGTVFRVTMAGVETVLYDFDGTHGASPIGGLILGTDGNFYGTTSAGGAAGLGTLFRITPQGT